MELQSSSYYKGKIDEFVALGKQLSGLSEYITTCSTSVTLGIKYLGEVVICNEPVDKNVLGENVAKTLSDVGEVLNSLISECNDKIEDYTDLYDAAVKAEERQARRERGLLPWI